MSNLDCPCLPAAQGQGSEQGRKRWAPALQGLASHVLSGQDFASPLADPGLALPADPPCFGKDGRLDVRRGWTEGWTPRARAAGPARCERSYLALATPYLAVPWLRHTLATPYLGKAKAKALASGVSSLLSVRTHARCNRRLAWQGHPSGCLPCPCPCLAPR